MDLLLVLAMAVGLGSGIYLLFRGKGFWIRSLNLLFLVSIVAMGVDLGLEFADEFMVFRGTYPEDEAWERRAEVISPSWDGVRTLQVVTRGARVRIYPSLPGGIALLEEGPRWWVREAKLEVYREGGGLTLAFRVPREPSRGPHLADISVQAPVELEALKICLRERTSPEEDSLHRRIIAAGEAEISGISVQTLESMGLSTFICHRVTANRISVHRAARVIIISSKVKHLRLEGVLDSAYILTPSVPEGGAQYEFLAEYTRTSYHVVLARPFHLVVEAAAGTMVAWPEELGLPRYVLPGGSRRYEIGDRSLPPLEIHLATGKLVLELQTDLPQSEQSPETSQM